MPRAVVCRELGPPERLTLASVARAPLEAGEVRVAVRAAGLNFPDVLMVEGKYQFKPDLPFVPGMEAAGDVAEVAGDVSGVRVGDKVVAKLRYGAFADEIVVSAGQLAPLPERFDYAEGATFQAAHGTAWHALVDRARIEAGEVLLVHGAGGGVGLAAVELGKVLGATVIAAASSEDKLAAARQRGADHTIRYGGGPLRDAVKRLTDGRGADVVLDPVGGPVFEQSLRCIAFGARLLVVGFTGGIGVAATNLLLIKGASVLGVRAGEAVRRDPALGVARQAALWRLAAEGRIRPNISHRLPMEECAKAMRLMIERRAIGRVALIMGG
jgi:NADPH2:quinone reductase